MLTRRFCLLSLKISEKVSIKVKLRRNYLEKLQFKNWSRIKRVPALQANYVLNVNPVSPLNADNGLDATTYIYLRTYTSINIKIPRRFEPKLPIVSKVKYLPKPQLKANWYYGLGSVLLYIIGFKITVKGHIHRRSTFNVKHS